MPSQRQRAAWCALLGLAGAFAFFPSVTSAAGPLDPIATPVASILASLVPAPLPTVKLPVATPTVRLRSLPVATSLPTVRLTPLPTVRLTPLPTVRLTPLPTVLPTLPVATPTLPLATPTLPTLPTLSTSPTPSQSGGPTSTSPSPPGGGVGPITGGGAGDPFVPQGGISSLVGPHNGLLGALPDLAVPTLIIGLPVLLLLLVLLAQGAGAAMWLPLVRRWMGGFGPLRRR